MHDIGVEELGLAREEGGGEVPEATWSEAEDGEAGFVGQRRGRVPGLDVLPEDEAETVGVFLPDEGRGVHVQGVEHLGGEGADVVEIYGYAGVSGEILGREREGPC